MSQQGCQEGRLSHTSDQQHTSRCSSASDFPQGGYGQLTFQHGIIGSGAGRAQRPSIIRGSSAFSSHGGRFKSKPKLADFGDIPDVAKHEWEVGAGHQRDFNLGVRKSYMSDVGKASSRAALSYYDDNAKEQARHSQILLNSSHEHYKGLVQDQHQRLQHYKSVAHEQRSTFLRQRLEAAGRYAASGLPPRSTHLHLSLPSSCGDITSVSNEEQQYMEQCMQHNSPQNMAQNIGQNMGQEQKESIGADEAPSHDAQMDQHNKGYAGSNVPGIPRYSIPRPMTPMAYASTKVSSPLELAIQASRGSYHSSGSNRHSDSYSATSPHPGSFSATHRHPGSYSADSSPMYHSNRSSSTIRQHNCTACTAHDSLYSRLESPMKTIPKTTIMKVLDWDLKPLASPAANRPTTSRQEKAEQIAMELISFEYAHRAHL